eukprot:TRINITY_DN3276_c2_g4_i1.p1 TRINITY_DN3276_c2_g4~~TRINITY_DN3276_c2_g4_i1.p1  ORF type:complete len:450 (-),score=142.04 TRINITY_DN3276_c2_g4_i1:1542-2891(-)
MITTLSWIPRGAAREIPIKWDVYKYESDDDENNEQENFVEEENSVEEENFVEEESFVEEDFEQNVSGSEEEDEVDGIDDDNMIENVDVFLPEDDPYMTGDLEEEPEDIEDFRLKRSDMLLLGGRTTDHGSFIDLYVLEREEGNLFIHHDYEMQSAPLCSTWIGYTPSILREGNKKSGNFAAVGSFQSPVIEIWNLDIVDTIEPALSLGGFVEQKISARKSKKKKGQMVKTFFEGSHEGTVMGLDWCQKTPQLLASSSDDTTIKLWDLDSSECLSTFTHHNEKVPCIRFHPSKALKMASASDGGSIYYFDANQETDNILHSYSVGVDPECMIWNSNNPNDLILSLFDGRICCFDIRSESDNCCWEINAAKQAITSIATSSFKKDLLASTCLDGNVRVFDMRKNNQMIWQKDMKVGDLYSVAFDNSSGVFSVGGSKGEIRIIDCNFIEELK